MTDVQTTLDRLIASPTISSEPIIELAAYVAQRCEDLGFAAELLVDEDDPEKASVLATLGPPDEDGLTISGHMDVVPVEGQPWNSDPFVMTERDGNLFGRGTADMKGFVACTLEALARLPLDNLRRQIALLWTHDEELGCLGTAKLVPRLKDRRLPTEALIGEPTDFQIFRMHNGHVGVTLTTTGESAHSSKPDLGANAISAMARVILMLEDLQRELSQERALEAYLDRPFTVTNPAIIRGGVAVNLVPDRCELIVGYRPLPGADPLAPARRIEARLAELTLPRGTTASVAVDRVTPSMLTPEGTPLAGLLKPHACTHHIGAASFATDGGNLAKLGMNCLIFGPGSIDVAHKADECVSIAALEKGVDVVEAVVQKRCF